MKNVFVSGFLILAFISFGCTKKETVQKTARPLLVGTDAAYAPFESEMPDKNLAGFDIEIMTAIAAKEGFEIKFVNTPWEGLFTQLGTGDRDILISAITITDHRKQQMDFSDPYFEAKQLIAVSEKSKIKKLADLKNVKVGVQTGTTGEEVVTKITGKNSPNVRRFEGTPLALQELMNGGVDAVVGDNGVVRHFLNNNANGLQVIQDDSIAPEFYGIAVKVGNQALLDKINRGLKAIRADGTYQKIYNQYFAEKK
jgi:polar amino acid transport system substrate-binding protein